MTSFARTTGRRAFLGAGIASLRLAILGQTTRTASAAQATLVSAGTDRFGERHTIGVSSTAFKVATADSRGDLFIMEHSNHKKGGVPRHLHHHEDEWFYVLEGDYIAEIGDKRVQLKPGDSILGPREVPHAWAFVGETPGRLPSLRPTGWKNTSVSLRRLEGGGIRLGITRRTRSACASSAWSFLVRLCPSSRTP